MDNDENEDVYENKFVETEEQGLKSRGREVDGRIKKHQGLQKMCQVKAEHVILLNYRS